MKSKEEGERVIVRGKLEVLGNQIFFIYWKLEKEKGKKPPKKKKKKKKSWSVQDFLSQNFRDQTWFLHFNISFFFLFAKEDLKFEEKERNRKEKKTRGINDDLLKHFQKSFRSKIILDRFSKRENTKLILWVLMKK